MLEEVAQVPVDLGACKVRKDISFGMKKALNIPKVLQFGIAN